MKLKENKDERVELKAEDYICNNDNEDDDEDFVPRNDYVDFVIKTLDELKVLFLEKNQQYSGENDSLANFRIGAAMTAPCLIGHHESMDYRVMFDEALAYERKHIAHVIRSGVEGVKVTESLKDIAVYSIIEMYIAKRFEEAKKREIANNEYE